MAFANGMAPYNHTGIYASACVIIIVFLYHGQEQALSELIIVAQYSLAVMLPANLAVMWWAMRRLPTRWQFPPMVQKIVVGVALVVGVFSLLGLFM